ncbi:Scr1 family TA system antitoxin-like transcriptional regulator [Streptomyces sp. TP-A0356]|uniref:Scr1 family TA system antitoxin-like transcriptional regulator n=1 Tax=Streptomyces sp. TP-A0356 TaxID=1359208 RepID=UPI000AED70F2|nr:Scr1 family TA system antitoxin-like transcriptional regulator [Streptomyces sp. TP-A0356]
MASAACSSAARDGSAAASTAWSSLCPPGGKAARIPEPNPNVVWVENLTNSVYFEGSDDVGRYTEVFDHLRATALGPPETRSRIKSMLKEL